jgi:AmpE protein
MTLISVLLALFLERFVGAMDDFRRLRWFQIYDAWLGQGLAGMGLLGGPIALAAILIPPLLVVWILQSWFDGVLLGLLELILNLAVLLYCFGPRDLENEVDAYVEAEAMGDADKIQIRASALIGEDASADITERVQAVTQATFFEANRRMFAVLFWFVLLGPVGALLYRLSVQLMLDNAEEETSLQGLAQRWVGLLDWIPARLAALGYGLTGHFNAVMPVWRHWVLSGWSNLLHANRALLGESGAKAVDLDAVLAGKLDATAISTHLSMVHSLILRTLVLWVTILALMTLGGWII